MNKIRGLFYVLIILTTMQSPVIAGDEHLHDKKGHKHVEKETCSKCKDKKKCKCETTENKEDNHDHKKNDGHDHGKNKNVKSVKPVNEQK